MKLALKRFLPIVALAGILVLGACGSKQDGASPNASAPASPSASDSASAPAAGQTIEVTVTGKNFAFEPAEIKAKAGGTLKITYKNDAGNHGLEIPDLNINLKNGQAAEVALDKAGMFEGYCSVMCGTGHDSMMMKVIVE